MYLHIGRLFNVLRDVDQSDQSLRSNPARAVTLVARLFISIVVVQAEVADKSPFLLSAIYLITRVSVSVLG